MTRDELADLGRMARTGQARLLRLCEGMSLNTAAAKVGVSSFSLSEWERYLSVPRSRQHRQAWYALLCSWRERHGDVTVETRVARGDRS